MKELSYEDWQKNPTPRMMWVWDENEMYKAKRKVVYVLRGNYKRVIAIDDTGYDYELYNHCVEIGEQRRMTNKELSRWLLDGLIKEGKHREWKHKYADIVRGFFDYPESEGSTLVNEDVLVRENGGEWHEPFVEVEE